MQVVSFLNRILLQYHHHPCPLPSQAWMFLASRKAFLTPQHWVVSLCKFMKEPSLIPICKLHSIQYLTRLHQAQVYSEIPKEDFSVL